MLSVKLISLANSVEGVMRIYCLLLTSMVVCASTVPVHAISWSVQMSCASDYYAYCSKHVAGSAGCHACMNTNRSKLSSACVTALIGDGVIPKTDVTQPKAKFAVSKPRPVPLVKVVPETKRLAKVRTEKVATAKRIAAQPAQKPVPAVLALDQQTFEAFKNRAPYFMQEAEETASIVVPE